MNIQTNIREREEVRFDTTPNASQLYNVVLQGFGYSMKDAVCDIQDNSVDAGAKNVTVVFEQAAGQQNKETGGAYVQAIWIIDDGCGMNKERLQKSFIFSTKVPHAEGSLGHFGAGGSAASFSIAEDKYVLTKEANGQLLVGTLSINSFNESGSFKDTGMMRAANDTEKVFFMKELGIKESNFAGCHGTIVGLTKINKNLNTTARKAATDLQKYCGEVYHQYISEGIIFRTILRRNHEEDLINEVAAADPLLHNYPDSLSYKHSENLEYVDSQDRTHIINVRYSILNATAGKGDLIEKQGIYVSRNKRQIVAHSALGDLWRKNLQTCRAGRMEINFPESLNEDMGLTSMKNKVRLDEELKSFLKPYVSTFRSKVTKRSTTPNKIAKEIEKQEKESAKKVVQHGGTLGVPEISAPAPTGRPNPDAGRGSDKKKRKKKDPNNTRRQYADVSFEHVSPNMPTDHPWWHKVTDDLTIIICINDDHRFVVDHYTEGTDEMKTVIRKWMVADILTQIEYQDNSTSRSVMGSFYRRISDIHNLGI
jgi:hypothetical protein